MLVETELPDGTPVRVMPLRREDRQALADAFQELSPESRRQRFLAPVERLSEAMLDHLVNDVDFVDHVAYVLAVQTAEDVFDPVAIGRMVRYEDQHDAADVAVTVKEAWQGSGIATTLLKVLVEHRPEGVTRVVSEVGADNKPSIAMLRRLGPTTVEPNGHGSFDIEVELWAAGAVARDEDDAQAELPSPGVVVTRIDDAQRRARRPRIDRDRHTALQTRDAVCPWLSTG